MTFRHIALLCLTLPTSAVFADEESTRLCSTIANKADRLQCYDSHYVQFAATRSYLTSAWDLDGRGNPKGDGIRRLEPYRKNYLLMRYTTNINKQPASPSPDHTVLTPYPYQNSEMKFQYSAKSEIGNYRDLALLGFKNFRLWGAFTQQAYWQAFNVGNSSPFRESNYEPELIGTFGTGRPSGWKLVNIGLTHQSNGRNNPDSRSWNRIYLQSGWEWDNIYLLSRGWWRATERPSKDDNPNITHYMGHAELIAHWSPGEDDEIILLLRSNLDVRAHKGFLQLDWASPLPFGRSSQFNFQLTAGYGESLIDYNHSQTTISMGLVFKEW